MTTYRPGKGEQITGQGELGVGVTIDGVDISSEFESMDEKISNIKASTTPFITYYNLVAGAWPGVGKAAESAVVVTQVFVPQGILRGFSINVDVPFMTSGGNRMTGDLSMIRVKPVSGVDTDADGLLAPSELYPASGLSCIYTYEKTAGAFAAANTITLGWAGKGQRVCFVDIPSGGAYVQLLSLNPYDLPTSGGFLFTVLMDQNVVFDPLASDYTSLFSADFGSLSALDAAPSPFTTGGDAYWTATTTESDGTRGFASPTAALGSGDVSDSQSSWLTYAPSALAISDLISFNWATSSEAEADFLTFIVVTPDGLAHTVAQKSGFKVGEAPFQKIIYVAHQAGVHTFKWIYTKNTTYSEGHDRGYVDDVQLWESPITETDENVLKMESYSLDPVLSAEFTTKQATEIGYTDDYTWYSNNQPQGAALRIEFWHAESSYGDTHTAKDGFNFIFYGSHATTGLPLVATLTIPAIDDPPYNGGWQNYYGDKTRHLWLTDSPLPNLPTVARTGNDILFDALYGFEVILPNGNLGHPGADNKFSLYKDDPNFQTYTHSLRLTDPNNKLKGGGIGLGLLVHISGGKNTVFQEPAIFGHEPAPPSSTLGVVMKTVTVGGNGDDVSISGTPSGSWTTDSEVMLIGENIAGAKQYEILTLPAAAQVPFSVASTKTWGKLRGIASALVPMGETVSLDGDLAEGEISKIKFNTTIDVGTDYDFWQLQIATDPGGVVDPETDSGGVVKTAKTTDLGNVGAFFRIAASVESLGLASWATTNFGLVFTANNAHASIAMKITAWGSKYNSGTSSTDFISVDTTVAAGATAAALWIGDFNELYGIEIVNNATGDPMPFTSASVNELKAHVAGGGGAALDATVICSMLGDTQSGYTVDQTHVGLDSVLAESGNLALANNTTSLKIRSSAGVTPKVMVIGQDDNDAIQLDVLTLNGTTDVQSAKEWKTVRGVASGLVAADKTITFTGLRDAAKEPDVSLTIAANGSYTGSLSAKTSANLTVAGTSVDFDVTEL